MVQRFGCSQKTIIGLLLLLVFVGCQINQRTYYRSQDISKYQNDIIISVRLKDGQEYYYNEGRGRCLRDFRGNELITKFIGFDIDNQPMNVDLNDVVEIQSQHKAWNYPFLALMTGGIIAVAIAIPFLIVYLAFLNSHQP